MREQEKITRLSRGFEQLCDQNKQYVIAISEVLLFAQDHMKSMPVTENHVEGDYAKS